MTPGRIALILTLIFAAFCLTLAGVVFVKLHTIETPDRYIALGLGLILLYMGGAILFGVIWPSKPKDPNAPIEIPPLDQVHGRTSYRDDSAWTRNGMILIGTIFLVVSLGSAAEQPAVLVFALVAVGVLAGAGVKIWRQIQYGRARLTLEMPARRGDVMRGVIATSGFAWSVVGRELDVHVRVNAIRTYRSGRSSSSIVVATAHASERTMLDGNLLTSMFTVTIPIIDTSEGRFSWNVVLETENPEYAATFLVDVA